MEKMNALYEKVAGDSELLEKFEAIMRDAEKAGEAATGEKLLSFAKDAGFEVTWDEVKAFFQELVEKSKEEMSEVELDMVAGGKSWGGKITIIASVFTFGLSCAGLALTSAGVKVDCGKFYE